MSYGRTGLIMRVWPEKCWFNGVQVRYSESYELPNRMTSIDTTAVTHYFPSRFKRNLYFRRIEEGQFERYHNTKYCTGFK